MLNFSMLNFNNLTGGPSSKKIYEFVKNEMKKQ
jgi:hypothetical protein